MRARWTLGLMAATTAVCIAAGCSDGGAGNVGGGATTTSGGPAATTTGSNTTGPTTTGSTTTGSTTTGSTTSAATTSGASSSGAMPGAKIVINEISAKGDDWVELYNPTSAAVDIGGYGLCDDVDPTMGHVCDMTTIVTFPSGTSVPPGGYLLIVGGESADASVGPHVQCLADGGPTTCFYASWKVSSSNGEMVHLLDPTEAVVDEELYPKEAVPSGQTWGRLPNGTGSFAANQPTPGAANEAP